MVSQGKLLNGPNPKNLWQFILLEITCVGLLVAIFAWFYKLIPYYAHQYDGMGNSLPLISRLVFRNATLGCLPLFATIVAYAALHLFLLKSFQAMKIALLFLITLFLFTIGTFWYAAHAPMWQLQHAIQNYSSASN